MSETEFQKTVDWLCNAIEGATNNSKFFTEGSLPGIDPELVVENLGPIRLPLESSTLDALRSVCHDAPFGKGTETVVDKNVRNSLELDPDRFSLGQRGTRRSNP